MKSYIPYRPEKYFSERSRSEHHDFETNYYDKGWSESSREIVLSRNDDDHNLHI